MSEVTPAAPAPAGDGGGTPAPAAPAPVAPIAPGTPEPIVPAAPTPEAKTPEQEADDAEAKEWEDAETEIFPGLKSRNKKPQEAKKNEQTKPGEKSKEDVAPEANPDDEKPDAQPGDGDDAKPEAGDDEESPDKPEDARPENPTREARDTARKIAEQKTAVANDVRAKMFGDSPEFLQDADGDPIKSIEDVMALIDPRTGDPFTEEAAAAWLLDNQRTFNENKASIEKQVEEISELHLDIADQADSINAKYGEWLKANPEKRNEIWAEFEESLIKDPKSGVITKMPMQMEKYYDRVVGPLVEASKATPPAPAAPATPEAPQETPEQKTAREAQERKDADKKRQQKRADRSDIYQPPADTNVDPDDAEWAEAEKAVFGNQAPKRK